VYHPNEDILRSYRVSLNCARRASPRRAPPGGRADRLVAASIVGAGIVCLSLLAWGHLGLGTRLFPPAATAPQQVAVAGPYRVTFLAASGQFTMAGPNTAAFTLRDQSGRAVSGVTLHLLPTMTTMAMDATDTGVQAAGNGEYRAHPRFSMAGEWRLTLLISVPGSVDQRASFTVGVRWN
jgi:hypothetical protein